MNMQKLFNKKWKVAIAVFLGLGILGSIVGGGDSKEPDKQASSAAESQPQKEESESTESSEESKPDIDPATMELTAENVKAIVEPILDADEVEVEVSENGDVDISYFRETFWSAKSEVKTNAGNSAKVFEQLYKNPATNEVWISELGIVMDGKGNESKEELIGLNTDRATVQDVNWENMKTLIYSDYTNIQNITVGYTQSMAIQNGLNE